MDGYATATRLIKENIDGLKALAEGLLERESLGAIEVDTCAGVDSCLRLFRSGLETPARSRAQSL